MAGLYSEFLKWTGLTHFHFILLVLIAVLLFGLYLSGRQFGLFHNVSFQEEDFPRQRILFISHQGSYENLG